jgi:hypothetical protein
MKNRKLATIGMIVVMSALMSLTCGLAFASDRTTPGERRPMTPELAAKREMVRKQHKQRITNEERKTAAEALKAERLKVYKAKQNALELPPTTIENK